jgi:hypothetical protein
MAKMSGKSDLNFLWAATLMMNGQRESTRVMFCPLLFFQAYLCFFGPGSDQVLLIIMKLQILSQIESCWALLSKSELGWSVRRASVPL